MPVKILIIDAADMGLHPGEIRIIPKRKISQTSFSTHSMPLSIFIDHMYKILKADIILVGIQPKQMCNNQISEEVIKSAEFLISLISKDNLDKIKKL
jgi:hydrogenase 3 maturation protease